MVCTLVWQIVESFHTQLFFLNQAHSQEKKKKKDAELIFSEGKDFIESLFYWTPYFIEES